MMLTELIRRLFKGKKRETMGNAHPHDSRRDQQEDENQAFTRKICSESMILPNRKFKNRNKCSQPFCTDCISKYIKIKVEDDNVENIKCPALTCSQFLDPVSCRSMIGLSDFVKWCDVLCKSTVLGINNSYCPRRNCNALILNECGGNLNKSQCPSCRNWFCFQCQMVWHTGFTCEESWRLRDRNDIAFERLVEQNKWHFVERIAGCNKINCRCGVSFYYDSGELWRSSDLNAMFWLIMFILDMLVLIVIIRYELM